MKLKCNDGKVRLFYSGHTDGQRLPSGERANGSAEAECEECHEKFGVHDLKILKPKFKSHVCAPMLKKEKRYYISGYGGEHDETGASIIDRETGTRICHTAHLNTFHRDWSAYYRNTGMIVAALNSYRPRKRKTNESTTGRK